MGRNSFRQCPLAANFSSRQQILQIVANQNKTVLSLLPRIFRLLFAGTGPHSLLPRNCFLLSINTELFITTKAQCPSLYVAYFLLNFFKILSVLVDFRQLVVRAYGTWSLGGTGEMSFFPVSCKEIRNISLTINYEYRHFY